MANETSVESDPFLKRLGLPVKSGKVKLSRGRYVLALGRTEKPIPTGLVAEAELKAMVGKEVSVAVSKGTIVLVVTKEPLPVRCFICYVPPPEFLRPINPALQRALVEQYTEAGILSAAQREILTSRIGQKGFAPR